MFSGGRAFYILLGMILIAISLVKMGMNRTLRESRKKDILKQKIPPRLPEANDFGQKIKWAIDTDEYRRNKESSSGPEPPADSGR